MAHYSLGIMTGTSCDGADLALLSIEPQQDQLKFTISKAFPSALRKRLLHAQLGTLSIAKTGALTRDYSVWLAALVKDSLKKWGIHSDNVLIAVHGQTVWHEPPIARSKSIGFSVQLIDPAIIAYSTGCTVTTFFRQPDLARGGQGAPLVPYYHWLRSQKTPFKERLPFAIQNIGGIANLTYITEDRRQVLAFDTGPGNALIDLAVARYTKGKSSFDSGGKIAASALGLIDWSAIEKLCAHPYFKKSPPKSTGRELFNEKFLKKLTGRGAELVANATALTAYSMARAYADFVVNTRPLRMIYIAGGGALNSVLIKLFESKLTEILGYAVSVQTLPEGFAPPQYLEAMAFAKLGIEALHGRPVSLASVTGAAEDGYGAGIFPGANFTKICQKI